MDYLKLTRPELQTLCKQRGLTYTGKTSNKPDLIKKLLEYDVKTTKKTPAPKPAPVLLSTEPELIFEDAPEPIATIPTPIYVPPQARQEDKESVHSDSSSKKTKPFDMIRKILTSRTSFQSSEWILIKTLYNHNPDLLRITHAPHVSGIDTTHHLNLTIDTSFSSQKKHWLTYHVYYTLAQNNYMEFNYVTGKTFTPQGKLIVQEVARFPR